MACATGASERRSRVMRWGGAGILAFFLFFSVRPVWALEDPVSINVDADNAPFMYSRGGKAAGLYPVLLASAFSRLNATVSIEPKPWLRALREIDLSLAGVGGIYKTDERVAKYDYSDPLFAETIVVYYVATHPIAFSSIEDLYGKRVGVIRGWSYGKAFDDARRDRKLIVEEVNGDRANFLKLAAGRLDALLAIDEAAKSVLADGKFLEIRQAEKPLIVNQAYLAFNQTQGKRTLLERFNGVLRAMRDDGSYDAIVREELGR